MDIKTILPKGKSGKKHYYWSIVIEQDWVQAGIWGVEDETSKVYSTSPAVHWKTQEELAASVDTALTAAVGKLEEEVEPKKSVFGVPDSWVKDGQINDEYLGVIKKICKELSLEPTGFVVLPEGIAHYIKAQESSALSGVILGLSSENVEITLVNEGRILGTQNVGRSVSLANDVIEGLSRFSPDTAFPPRFVIYDGKEAELEDARQELVKTDWESQEKIQLLHTPKIEVVKPEDKVLAISLAGGSEIANTKSVTTTKTKEEIKEEEKLDEELANVIEVDEDTQAENLGFVLGEDIVKTKVAQEVVADGAKPDIAKKEAEPLGETKRTEEPKFKSDTKVASGMVFVKGYWNKFSSNLKSLFGKKKHGEEKEKTSKGKRLLIGGGVVLALLILVGILAWWFLPKAEVTVFVAPKQQEQSLTFTVDTSAEQVNEEELIIPGRVESVSASGEKTKSTTGTKTTGEKASGSVEVRNGTSDPIKVVSGTVLASVNDLEFASESTASVSAAISPTQPGSATIDVTAEDIGSEYNLAKDEVFKVGNYDKSEIDGIALSDFSGGSSNEISVVSSDDANSLEEELEEELLKEAMDQLKGDLTPEEILIEDSVIIVDSSKDYSDSVGDEASTLKLSLEMDVEAIVVKKDDLFAIVDKVAKEKVPEGYVLKSDQVETAFDLDEVDDGVYTIDLKFKANLLPEINPDEIVEEIAGKYPGVAEDYLVSIPGFTRAEVVLIPKLPGRLGTLPKVEDNITVIITAEK